MKKISTLILIILVIIVISAGWLLKIILISQDGTGLATDFLVEDGSSVNKISKQLKQRGLIDSSLAFETYLWLKNYEGRILAGEHRLNDTWSIRQITNALITGNSVENELVIKTIEGWNLYDLADYLVKNNLATREEFYQLVGRPGQHDNYDMPDWTKAYEFLTEKPKGVSLEGYLFPDTYRIFKNSSAEDIIIKMLNNFDKKIDSRVLGDIDNQNRSLYEILTLASIIEKEARTPEDKKRVAGVYYNRLKINMALQADPTVNYVTGKQTDRPSLDDLKADSLYNTYKYPGLPPGPICNPGLNSILAAVYPEKNNYFYFINTPEGDMVFARTLEEHAANRAKYFINN